MLAPAKNRCLFTLEGPFKIATMLPDLNQSGTELKSRKSTSRRIRRRSRIQAADDLDLLRGVAHGSIHERKPPTTERAGNNEAAGKNSKTRFDYIRETMRPIVCLAFVLPMLMLYEFGSIFSDQLSGKSGIDQWFQWLMNSVGIGHLVILPMLTTGILLFWHHRLNDRWHFQPSVLLGMLLESCCLGLTLYFAGNAVYQIISEHPGSATLAIAGAESPCWQSTITFIGCGVYEELIFRLLLLSGLIHFGKFYLGILEAKTISMIITSLIFAALHYDFFNPAGAPFEASGFLFRLFASLIFCILFLSRGFGIAVGTHAVYDVMTQL